MSTFKSLNPTNLSDVVVETKLATADDIAAAARRAKAAQKAWAKMPAPARGRVIANAGRLFENNKEALSKLVTREMGKVYREALGDVQEVIDTCDFFLGEGRRLYGQTVPSEMPNKNLFTFRMPVGTALIITAGNFPAAVPSWYIIPALLTGNSVVWKPSEFTPLSSVMYSEMIHDAGFPPGVFNMIQGDGPLAGATLSKHPDIAMMSFTGSTRAGSSVSKDAADSIKRVALELGGKSPNIVFADCNLEERISGSIEECYINTGQSCDAPTRLLVERSCYQQVLEIAKRLGEAVKVDDPAIEGNHLGPLVSDIQYGRVQAMIEKGIKEGATLLVGGLGRPEGFEKGYWVRPTIFADAHNKMAIAQEEIFGPVLTIIPFDSEEEAIEIANDTPYGLAGYVQSGDIKRAERIAKKLRVGMVHINGGGFNYGSPFGGYKQSGNGREGGIIGIEDFQEVKTLHYPE